MFIWGKFKLSSFLCKHRMAKLDWSVPSYPRGGSPFQGEEEVTLKPVAPWVPGPFLPVSYTDLGLKFNGNQPEVLLDSVSLHAECPATYLFSAENQQDALFLHWGCPFCKVIVWRSALLCPLLTFLLGLVCGLEIDHRLLRNPEYSRLLFFVLVWNLS